MGGVTGRIGLKCGLGGTLEFLGEARELLYDYPDVSSRVVD